VSVRKIFVAVVEIGVESKAFRRRLLTGREDEVDVGGEAQQVLTAVAFVDQVGGVSGAELRFGGLDGMVGGELLFRGEPPRDGDVAFGPFQLVELGKILDQVLVSRKRLGHLTQVDDAGTRLLGPVGLDDGMGEIAGTH